MKFSAPGCGQLWLNRIVEKKRKVKSKNVRGKMWIPAFAGMTVVEIAAFGFAPE